MSKQNPFGLKVSYKPKQASVNPEPIQAAYIGLTDEDRESVGDLFLENNLITDIIHVNMKNDNKEAIRSIFNNTSSYNSSIKKIFLLRDIGKIMNLLDIRPDGSNIKQYGDFWSALSESINTVKSLSSNATTSAAPAISFSSSSAAAGTPAVSSSSKIVPVKLTNEQLAKLGISRENEEELGGGARRRKRKTKKMRKSRRTRRNNKK